MNATPGALAAPIRITLLVPSSREVVFAAFSRNEFLCDWLVPMNGEVHALLFVPRVGRSFSFELVTAESRRKVAGRILDLVPLERISFSYGSLSELVPETRVDLLLKVAYGGTQLILTENGNLQEQEIRRKRKLWKYMLRNLARSLPPDLTGPEIRSGISSGRKRRR